MLITSVNKFPGNGSSALPCPKGQTTEAARSDNHIHQTTPTPLTLSSEIDKFSYELTENIPVGVYSMIQPATGGMGHFHFLSKRFLEMTGLDRAAAIADPMNAFACVHPDDHAEWVRKNAHVFEHKLPFCEECRIIVHGETRWVRAESIPRDLPDGSVVWEGVLIDITAQKKAEASIARSEEAFRHMLDTLPFPVGICVAGETHRDPGADITFLNKRFVKMLGYTLADIPTVEAWATTAYPDEMYRQEVFAWWDAAVRRLTSGQSSSEFHESRVRTKRGGNKEIFITAAAMENKLIVTFQDISEHRKTERKRDRTKEQLQRVIDRLAPRQYQIFRLIGKGMSSEQIGRDLGISVQTVQATRKIIARKLGTSGNELVRQAFLHQQALAAARK